MITVLCFMVTGDDRYGFTARAKAGHYGNHCWGVYLVHFLRIYWFLLLVISTYHNWADVNAASTFSQ